MKVLLINPPGPRYLFRGTVCTYISKARYVWKPKDFILITSVLPPEWKVDFIDAAIRRMDKSPVMAKINEFKPDAIVIAMSSIVWHKDLQFLQEVRRALPTAKIVVFGEVFMEPTLGQEALKYADSIIYDPVRSNIKELLEGTTSAKELWTKQPKNTKEIRTHVARHDLFDYIKYRWPFVKHFRFAAVYTQYGCPFVCSYCTESLTQVSYRPADNLLEELDEVHKQGYRELHIGDASFGYPHENAVKLLEGMIAKKYNFSWSSYVYPGLADAKMIELMARSGCHTVVIGIDSADGALLQKYGRNLPGGKIKDFVENCHKNNIEVCGDLMIGFAEDTKESCLKTIDLSIDLNLDYSSFNIVTPLLGSSVREQQKDKGIIGSSSTGYDTAGMHKVSGTSQLSSEDLIWMRNHAVRKFYLRPSYFLKRLSRLRGIEDLLIKYHEGYGIILNLLKAKRTLQDGYL